MQILLCFSFKNTDEKAIKIFKWMDTSKDLDLTIFKVCSRIHILFYFGVLAPTFCHES